LFDREGTVPETGVGAAGDVGSTEPQLTAARAAKTTMTMDGARMMSPSSVRVRDAPTTQDAHPPDCMGWKLHRSGAQ
jgi:hypothetical protein